MLTPSTKLSSVNAMLAAVGEAPITNLAADLSEAQTAINILDDVSRETQTRGWSWNTVVNRKIKRTSTDEVMMPAATLAVDIKDPYTKRQDRSRKVTYRNNKLYDLLKSTYEFEDDPTVDIIIGLDFDELPESARRYITLDATSRYMQTILGADVDMQTLQQQAIKAWVQLEQEEDNGADLNIISDQPLSAYTAIRTRHVL